MPTEPRYIGKISPIFVDTIQDLRDLPVSDSNKIPEFVSARGYSAIADGGGGPVRSFVSGASPGTYVDNGGSVIVPTGGDGSSAWVFNINSGVINLLDFGGLGDGNQSSSSINSSAIANAIQSFGPSDGTPYGVVEIPEGTFYFSEPISLTFQVSLRGVGSRATKIVADGDFAAINWANDIPSYSRQISISNLWIVGGGVASGFSNNTGIHLNHPFGIDELSLKDLRIDGFSEYGIKTDQQGSYLTTNCFQFSHWDNVHILNCGTGILMGEGFCGESLFSNIIITGCTNNGISFSIGPVAGSQGLQFDNLVIGQCDTGLLFGAGNTGMITFNNAHIENCTTYAVRSNNVGATGIRFNDSWLVNTPTLFRGDAGGRFIFSSCVWQGAGSATNKYIDLAALSAFVITIVGDNQTLGTAVTTQITAVDINAVYGQVSRKSGTTATFARDFDTRLAVQTRGLMSETTTVRPSNLGGSTVIGNGVSFISVALPRTESDTSYYVVGSVNIVGDNAGAWIPGWTIEAMTTSGFKVYFSSPAPIGGFIFRWLVFR